MTGINRQSERKQSSAEVKERVELYIYSASGPSWPYFYLHKIIFQRDARAILRNAAEIFNTVFKIV
jgi:hypothetical protein